MPLVNLLYTCVIENPLSSVACSSGIMVLQCFGHVYKLDCDQLKLVCQSMKMWPQITLLYHAVKVRSGNGVMYGEETSDSLILHATLCGSFL